MHLETMPRQSSGSSSASTKRNSLVDLKYWSSYRKLFSAFLKYWSSHRKLESLSLSDSKLSSAKSEKPIDSSSISDPTVTSSGRSKCTIFRGLDTGECRGKPWARGLMGPLRRIPVLPSGDSAGSPTRIIPVLPFGDSAGDLIRRFPVLPCGDSTAGDLDSSIPGFFPPSGDASDIRRKLPWVVSRKGRSVGAIRRKLLWVVREGRSLGAIRRKLPCLVREGRPGSRSKLPWEGRSLGIVGSRTLFGDNLHDRALNWASSLFLLLASPLRMWCKFVRESWRDSNFDVWLQLKSKSNVDKELSPANGDGILSSPLLCSSSISSTKSACRQLIAANDISSTRCPYRIVCSLVLLRVAWFVVRFIVPWRKVILASPLKHRLSSD